MYSTRSNDNIKKSYLELASPQTSFGVRLSRIHFSPTVRGGEMNE